MPLPTLADYFDARKELGPIASDDSALLLNVDFTAGVTAIDAILVTANGFTKQGSGGTWSAASGFNPNRTRYYTHSNWVPVGHASRAAAFADNEFSIYMEIQRSALTATWMDDNVGPIMSGVGPSSACWDGAAIIPANHPYGDYTGGTKIGKALSVAGSVAGSLDIQYQVANNGGMPVGRLSMNQNDGSAANTTMRFQYDVISHADIDPDYAKFLITAKQREVRWYIDGQLVRRKLFARDWWSSDMDFFDTVGIGGLSAATTFIGYIKTLQIANRALLGAYTPVGTRTAFGPGDSFVQSGSSIGTPASNTVALIDAEQNFRDSVYAANMATASDASMNPVMNINWNPFIRGVSQYLALEGLPIRAYVAGHSGHGWSNTVGAGTTQFAQAYIDALIAFNPEILVCIGSINDVSPTNPPVDLIAETKLILDQLIDGCSALRRLVFFQTFPGHKGYYGTWTAAHTTEYKRQITLQYDLDGYRDIVEFVPVYDALGGDNYSGEFNIGGSQYAALYDIGYPAHGAPNPTAGGDPHPSQYGANRIAEIVGAYLAKVILALPTL